jgi:hypothetical protein
MHTNNFGITLPKTKVNGNKQWANTKTYIEIHNQNIEIPPCLHSNEYKTPKIPNNSYYEDGSYIPPKSNESDKPSNIAGYGIYNNEKKIIISFKI